MRTRLQEAFFFRQFNEEKKKRAGAVNGGDQSSVKRDGDSGVPATVDGGDSRSPANSERFEPNGANVGFEEGLGFVSPKEGGNLGVESDGKQKEGFLIGGEREEIQEGLRKQVNVGRADLEENCCECSGRMEERNKSVVDGVVCGGDDGDESDGEVVFLGMNCSNKIEVGSRKKQKSCENLWKNKNVVETGEGGDDDEVVFLRIDYSKAKIRADGVVQKGVMGSDGDIDLPGSKEASESRDVMESDASGSVESVSDSGDSEECESYSEEDSVGSTDVDSEGSPSCSGYEAEDDEDERSVSNGKGNEKMTEDGSGRLKRMKYSGLDLLVGCDREGGKEEAREGPKSVAERLHLRPPRGNKKELGSFSCPCILTDEGIKSSSAGDDDGTNIDEDERSDRTANGLKKVGKSGEKSKGKVGRPPAKRRNCHGDSADTCFENCDDAKKVWKSHEKSKGKVGRPAKRRHGCAGFAVPIPVERSL